MRVAEEHKERPACKIHIGNRLAVLIDQFEGPANRRTARLPAAKIARRVEKYAGENHQTGQKRGNDEKDLRRPGRHDISTRLKNTPPTRYAPFRRTPRFRSSPKAQKSQPAAMRPPARPAEVV